MPDRTCTACGISIAHRHHLAKTCSTACSQWARKHPGEPRPTRHCIGCGKGIAHLSYQATACSQGCTRWARLYPGIPKPDKIVRSAETRAKLAAGRRGKKHSDATKARLSLVASQTLRGHQVSAETRAKIAGAQSGKDGHQWAGDEVGYGGAHKRHRAELPSRCEHCGATEGILHAALRVDAPREHLLCFVRARLLYSPLTEDYIRLCPGCHVKYDRSPDAVERRRGGSWGVPDSWI